MLEVGTVPASMAGVTTTARNQKADTMIKFQLVINANTVISTHRTYENAEKALRKNLKNEDGSHNDLRIDEVETTRKNAKVSK